jgi:nicotinamide-nucleotide amidase
MAARFTERRMAMPPNNERQTEVLDGATVLANRNGSAPGQFLDTTFEDHRKLLVLLPGPPKELKPLFDEACKPLLAQSLPPRFLARRQLRMALIPESQVDARTAPIYGKFKDVETTILAGRGEIQLHFLCTKPTQEEAEARVNALTELVEHEMGDDIFSADGESLEEIVILMLGLRDLTLSVAESLTGGRLSERLTSVVNASRSFHGGVVVYTNEQKKNLCDVPMELLQEKGAVSEEVARAMAEGIRRKTGCSLGLALTGIAGPPVTEGPDAGKAVGLVYLALADEDGTQVRELTISGDRERIRLWSTEHALEMVRRNLQ